MGLRLALGALPGQVLQMVLRESFTLVAVGLVLGLAVAFSVRRSSSRRCSDSPPPTR
jgi:ABC-type antimicrobial peptide transport system permease subunit